MVTKQPPSTESQPQSPPKTPLTATLESARERTKSATSAIRTTLARSTRPKNENIYNIPNFLTATRLVAAPVTAYLLLHDQHTAAFLLFAYAGITDLVDGYLARKWNLQTVAGSVMDPMADKALMIIMTATLGVKGLIPASLAALILGRDASLAIAALYYRYASLPAPKTFMRYWDFSLPSAEVHPTTVSKYNTFLQLVLLGSALALPVLTADSHHLPILHDLGIGGLDVHEAKRYFEYLVAATTVWSGLSYAFLKNAVTILGDDAALKAKQGAMGRAIIGVTFGSVLLGSLYLAAVVDEKREDEREIVEKMTKKA
jgi:cardiolipin synthase